MIVDSVGRGAAVDLDRACPQRRAGHRTPGVMLPRPPEPGARRTVTRTRAAGCGWLARARS